MDAKHKEYITWFGIIGGTISLATLLLSTVASKSATVQAIVTKLRGQ